MLSTSTFAAFLNEKGWQGSDISFIKDGIEIWRDTSSWVEVYKIGKDNIRLLNHHVENEHDLQQLLDLIEKQISQ